MRRVGKIQTAESPNEKNWAYFPDSFWVHHPARQIPALKSSSLILPASSVALFQSVSWLALAPWTNRPPISRDKTRCQPPVKNHRRRQKKRYRKWPHALLTLTRVVTTVLFSSKVNQRLRFSHLKGQRTTLGSHSVSHLGLEYCLDHGSLLRVISLKTCYEPSDVSKLSFDWGGWRAKLNGLTLKSRVHTRTDVKCTNTVSIYHLFLPITDFKFIIIVLRVQCKRQIKQKAGWKRRNRWKHNHHIKTQWP